MATLSTCISGFSGSIRRKQPKSAKTTKGEIIPVGEWLAMLWQSSFNTK